MTQQGKRHHTRFFPTEQENADKDGNPKPGTVVDRGVTSVYHFDFFLQGTFTFHIAVTLARVIKFFQLTGGFKALHVRLTIMSFTTTLVSRLTNYKA